MADKFEMLWLSRREGKKCYENWNNKNKNEMTIFIPYNRTEI